MAKKRICLDAGHYGKYNRSPVNKAYWESEAMWRLHLLQKKYLEQYGFEVITTRSNQDKDRDLYGRGYAAKDCDLFISDHSNACGTESVDYPVVYRSYDNSGNSDELALKLAKVISATMGTRQIGRTATRKGSRGEYYGVLRGARAAGLKHYYIIEHSFHTNASATEWLLNDSNLDKLARAEAKAIAEYYNMTSNAADVPEPEEPQKPAEPEKHIIAEDGKWGSDTTRKAQEVFKCKVVDGIINNQLNYYKEICDGLRSGIEWDDEKRNGSALVKAIQKWLGIKKDGWIGPKFICALQEKMGTPVDCKFSNPSMCIKAFQHWLNQQ